MTNLEALAVQYRAAERAWHKAFLAVYVRPEDEKAARLLLVRARLALDAEIERVAIESKRLTGD